MARYRIAGLLVEMNTFGRTQRQAEIYRVQDAAEPDIVIYRKERLPQMAEQFTEEEFEYMLTGRQFYNKLLQFDGMMLHSSCVIMAGKAYLFSAPSGTGKSTHTQLWTRVFGPKAQILNDDKPALRCIDGVWYAYGTPWTGKSTTSLNLQVPVGGICFLHRSAQNTVRKISPQQAVYELLNQTVRFPFTDSREKQIAIIDRLASQVPVYEMYCNMEPEAALLSHCVMSGEVKI